MTELPFGRYRGRFLALVPAGYLRWFISTVRFDDDELRAAIEQALAAHEEEKRRRGWLTPAEAKRAELNAKLTALHLRKLESPHAE